MDISGVATFFGARGGASRHNGCPNGNNEP